MGADLEPGVEDWGRFHTDRELLCRPGDEEEGGRRVAHLCHGPGELRTPAGRAEGAPFGAIRWLTEPPALWQQTRRGYLGLALD